MSAAPVEAAQHLWTLLDTGAVHAVMLGKKAGGQDPVFVLVHGLGMSSRYMMPTATRLAVCAKVYVPDLPGFGLSAKPAHCLTIPELSDALAAWLSAQQISAPVLIGNSLGAQVIADFASRFPGRIAGAVLIAPTVDPWARKVTTQLYRLLADALREPMALYWIAVTDYFRAGLFRILQTLHHALTDPILLKLPAIRTPVLIIRGGRDPIVPQAWVEQAVALIPDARLVVIPAAAHAVNFDSPDALVEEVLVFLKPRRTVLPAAPSQDDA